MTVQRIRVNPPSFAVHVLCFLRPLATNISSSAALAPLQHEAGWPQPVPCRFAPTDVDRMRCRTPQSQCCLVPRPAWRTARPRPCRIRRALVVLHQHRGASHRWLVLLTVLGYGHAMYATAIVDGKVIRFRLSPALARAHRENRGKTMTDQEAVEFVEAKRRARALRRAKPYLESHS